MNWHQIERPSEKCIKISEKKSQLHQDMWVSEMNDCQRDKFYIDIGAFDGEMISNTNLLDKKYGWKGICIDPYPKNMESRTCKVDTSVLYDKTGETVTFRNAGNSALSGIDTHIKDSPPHDRDTRGSPTSMHTTTSAADTFKKYDIPSTVDYLNMDVEGAELKILQGMVTDKVFDKHCFRTITIEHNFVEPNRTEIRKLLESQGYIYYGTEDFDDYYICDCDKRGKRSVTAARVDVHPPEHDATTRGDSRWDGHAPPEPTPAEPTPAERSSRGDDHSRVTPTPSDPRVTPTKMNSFKRGSILIIILIIVIGLIAYFTQNRA